MRVGVVGLGLMGEPIARRLLQAGHEVTVWNRTHGRAGDLVEQGAREASDLNDVWETASVVITMVSDDKALRAVTLGDGGLLRTGGPGRTLIDMSTVSVDCSREAAGAAGKTGVAYLRAPVSGNPSVVEAGNLAIIVSGDREAFDAVSAPLADIGPHVFYVGEEDEARVLKLALNLMIAGTAQLMAEALVLGEANGLDRATILEVMGGSAIGSPFVKYKTDALVADNYTSTFPTQGMYKDLGLALDAGNAVGASLPVTALVRQFLQACISSGMADADFMALLPRLQRDSGREPALVGAR
jgi:3-hydroxyisobutyrate dehydrogenase-like beta-hydroxyacid dehydrogenase